MKQKKLKPAFRYDSRPWTPGGDQKAVTPGQAYEAMTGESGSEAEAARLRMLRYNLRYLLAVLVRVGMAAGEIRERPAVNVQFRPLWHTDEQEEADAKKARAAAQLARARTAAAYLDMGALRRGEVRQFVIQSKRKQGG